MQDRRQFIRWQINRQTQCKLEGALTFASCTIHDISLRGARLSLAQLLPKDTPLKLSIILSEEFTCLEVEIWVVWHKRIMDLNSYGVYFAKIRDVDKEKIYKFMRSYYPEQVNRQWWQETKLEGGEKEMEKKKDGTIKDRRIFERFLAKFPVRFIDLKRNREGEAQVHNVSAKGLGIVTKEELIPDTSLEMWLDIPDRGESLYTRGEVVWSMPTKPDEWRAGINLEKADLMGMSRIFRRR